MGHNNESQQDEDVIMPRVEKAELASTLVDARIAKLKEVWSVKYSDPSDTSAPRVELSFSPVSFTVNEATKKPQNEKMWLSSFMHAATDEGMMNTYNLNNFNAELSNLSAKANRRNTSAAKELLLQAQRKALAAKMAELEAKSGSNPDGSGSGSGSGTGGGFFGLGNKRPRTDS